MCTSSRRHAYEQETHRSHEYEQETHTSGADEPKIHKSGADDPKIHIMVDRFTKVQKCTKDSQNARVMRTS